MRSLRAWLLRLTGAFQRQRRDREFADEIAAHVAMHTEDNIRLGMPPDEAHRLALARLGGLQTVSQQYREQAGIPLLEHVGHDLLAALRALKRSPGFTVLALTTIALGVSGPTLMFAMAKQWILDPLPFLRPEGIVDIRHLDKVSGRVGPINAADLLDWQREAASLDELAAYRRGEVRLTALDRAERLRAAEVTPNFFRLLGAQPSAGRVLEPADGKAPFAKVVVISDAMSRRQFPGDETIVGRVVRLDHEDYTIVGVLPGAFQFTLLGAIDVWKPLVIAPAEAADRRGRSLIGIGRVRAGRTIADVRTELGSLADRLAAMYPDTNARRGVRVMPLAEEVRLHHDAGVAVPILFAMTLFVLLIACVNVANVMFARASARRQEMAVCLALGASRARIVRQWLAENLVLFVAASAVGVGLAVYGADWVAASIPPDNRQYLRDHAVLTIDGAVLSFALTVGVLCGVLFGLLPAWKSARADVSCDLRDSSPRTSTGTAGGRLRGALVASEMALALALLVGAGLLFTSARNITSVDVGFDPRQLLTFQMSLDVRQYATPDAVRGFYERLTATVRQLPGVQTVSAASLVPFSSTGGFAELFLDGQPDTAAADTQSASLSAITADYPVALGLRLRAGRLLEDADDADAPRAAVVNEAVALRYFAARDPIGQRIRLGRGSTNAWRIVGVVANVKNFDTREPDELQVYVPFAQSPRREATVVIRAPGEIESLASSVRAAVSAIDPAEPIVDLATMDTRIERATGPFVTMSTFAVFFAGVSLLLAGVGVYGVVSYAFAQRTREIGIRMALGARRADVAALVLAQVRTFLIAGAVPGLALAWLLGRGMEALLFGVTAADWTPYVAMTLLLTLVALVAVLVPARRATTIDPAIALRCE